MKIKLNKMSILQKEHRLVEIAQKVPPQQFVFLSGKDRVMVLSHYLKENEPENYAEFLLSIFPEFHLDIDNLLIFLMSKSYFPDSLLEKIYSTIDTDAHTLIRKALLFKCHVTPIIGRIISLSKVNEEEIDWDYLLGFQNLDSETRLFLEEKAIQYKIAPIPVWVFRNEGETPPFIYAESEMTFEENDSIIEKFARSLNIDPSDEEDLNHLEEIASYLDENARMIVTDPLIDRYYGLQNAILGKKCCSFDGRCRMLECKCDFLKSKPEIDLDSVDWFDNHCKNCLATIRDRSHAIRYPLKNGSWRGCYCSLECMAERYKEKKRSFAKINNLKTFLSTVGIYDRLER